MSESDRLTELSSEDVKRLQIRLQQLGLYIDPTEIERGYLGPATRQSVMQFQSRNGLPQSGILDEQTATLLQVGNAVQTSCQGSRPRRIGIVLSGWAPAMTLMSGVMLGFMAKGVKFDVISTSGAGALIGLLCLAPKGRTAQQALQQLPNLFVSDMFYSFLPINTNVFFKYGPFSKGMYDLREKFKLAVDPADPSPFKRLFNDWVNLKFSLWTPTTFELKTKGMMSHSPQIDEFVDFRKLRDSACRFYVNAFNLNTRDLCIFDNKNTDTAVYHASEALPVLFEPQRVGGGDLFTTGATHDPTGLQAIWLKEKQNLDMILALDPMSAAIWRAPLNIHDAFQLMLMNPILALETLLFSLYARIDHLRENADPATKLPALYRIPFSIDKTYYPEMLKWTYSNAITLQKIGYDAATAFTDAWRADDIQKYRFYNYVEAPGRMSACLRPFPALRVREEVRDQRINEAVAEQRQRAQEMRERPAAARNGEEAEWWSRPSRLGVLASGGAPNVHLVAGALCAFYEKQISFDVIGASGAGAFAGLLYAVPAKEGDQVAALQETVNINVYDTIYDLLPMNYKVFFKRGPFARAFWQLGQSLHRPLKADERYGDTLTRMYNDTVDFVMSALTPTTLNYFSKGICTRVGALDDKIGWDRLKTYPKEFYLNAFDLETQQLEVFDKTSLNPTTFWSALAMPWLYEPASANGKTYTEGASHDPVGLEALIECNTLGPDKLDKLIVVDSVGPDLWTDPENIYDALQTTIIDPIVSLGEYVLAAYGILEYFTNASSDYSRRLPKLYRVPFQTPDWETPHILEWSYSNALTLWHAGHQAADNFADTLLAEVRDPAALERYRYYPSVKDAPRIRNFLALFDGIEGALPVFTY